MTPFKTPRCQVRSVADQQCLYQSQHAMAVTLHCSGFHVQELMERLSAKPAGYEDPVGTAMLLDLQSVLTVWKRPAELLPSISDIPMHIPNPLSAADSKSFAGKLFCGHSALRWLCACFNSIQEVRVRQATYEYQSKALSRLPGAAPNCVCKTCAL